MFALNRPRIGLVLLAVLALGIAGGGKARAWTQVNTVSHHAHGHVTQRNFATRHRQRQFGVRVSRRLLRFDRQGHVLVLTRCSTAYRIIRRRHGRVVKVRGLLCRDAFGRAYLMPDGRVVLDGIGVRVMIR